MLRACLLSLLFFFTVSVRADVTREKCADRDFADEFGPPRDQGSSGWCHAFAAADLIGQYQGFGTSKRISAFDVAITEFRADADAFRKSALKVRALKFQIAADALASTERAMESKNGGDVGSISDHAGSGMFAIALYNGRGGACLESKLASQRSFAYKMSGDYVSDRLSALGEDAAAPQPLPRTKFERDFGCPIAPATGTAAVADWKRELNASLLAAVDSRVNELCGERIPLKPMMPVRILASSTTPERFPATLASIIDRGKPMIVNLSGSFLKSGALDGPSDHIALIVGTKWNTEKGRCEFHLRNSWGGICEGYQESLKESCKAGSIWLSEDDVRKSVTQATYIKP
jgi:hypothetical protein